MKRLQKFKKQKFTKKLLVLAAILVVVTSAFIVPVAFLNQKTTQAATADELRAQAAALQAQIDANNAEAARLAGEADTLQNKLAILNTQIARLQAQIDLTTTKISELQIQLDQAQVQLDKQKGLLKASLQALYKKGGASTVELLVGSDSFSQFINDQTYLEKLKESIQTSTEKVIALKQQIQAQQEEQKTLLSQQQSEQTSLNMTRAEQQRLLNEKMLIGRRQLI
jgi:septal ring factor EnvC (AmiA/AmiB activator)